jgi:hypothetical protein
MHGENCAGVSCETRDKARPVLNETRRCQSPSCVSTDGACAHGRTLNSRCHRSRRRARTRNGEACFLRCESRVGGADRDRTDDLKLAKLPLSQLSYGPDHPKAVVGPDRFELSTPRLSSVCSNQLSYGPSPAAAVRETAHAATGLAIPRRRTRQGEKRNEDGGEPLCVHVVREWTRDVCPKRSRGSACADVQSQSSLERR